MSTSAPPSGSTSPLAFPGAILTGRYRLEEVVGYGGMGSVWRATHLGLGEQVAVKLVSANFVRSTEALRRFDNEAKSAAKIRSRHVPQVFDNGVLEDGTPFLVMELLHGESLAARVNRLGPVPLPETVSIIEQTCRALSRAHSLGIVHRDIKPENVYLAHSVDDDGYVVKVLDFGIAKVTTPLSEDGRSSTRTGTLLGTPLFMSPEQARGLRSVDFRTDLYSVGLVAYTMLSGRLPFSGETLGELLLQICAEPLPSLRAAMPTLPPALEHWFQKACARQPDDRYASAQAQVEALRVAAGLSAPHQSESVARMSTGPEFAASTADPSRTPHPNPAGPLHVPSTTEGTSLGTSSFTQRPRPVIVVASAAVAMAVGAVLVFALRSGKGRTEAPGAAVMNAAATPAASLKADASPPHVTLTPLTPEGVPATASTVPAPVAQPNASAALEKPSPPPPVTAARPATGTIPPATPRPVQPQRPATKPTGDIDLGY